jgi:hypothetical protein
MNYQTEDLHVFIQMTVKWSINFQYSSVVASIKLLSNLVKLIKTLISLKRSLGLMDFNMFGYLQTILALIGPPRFGARNPGKSLG